MTWSAFDSLIEFALVQETALDWVSAHKKYASTNKLAMINEIEQIAERNSIMHGIIKSSSSRITFIHRQKNHEFNIIKSFNLAEFEKYVRKVTDLSAKLQIEFQISDEDFYSYFQVAESI